MIRGCLLVCSLVALAGCMKQSATYCDNHAADDPQHCPPADAPGGPCTSSNDCVDMPGTLVCNTATSTCVQCNAASSQMSACVDTAPVCGDNDMCRACRLHTECASGACLPDGRCGSDADVAFVDATPGVAMGSACTQAMPCDRVSKALAVMPPKSYVMIKGTVLEPVLINDRDVTLLGAVGAGISSTTSDSAQLEVTGTSDVVVYDLTLGGGGTRTFGVKLGAATGSLMLHRVRVTDNSLGGISATGGQLTVLRSTISDNVKGGIVVRSTAGKFDIRNNFIYSNGASSGTNATLYGGVLIENDVAGKLEFNTVALNQATGVQNRAGIACYGVSNSANGNLAYGNRDGLGGPDSALQIGGDCPRGTSYALGTGDLGFKNPSLSTPDFHLTETSPTTVRDAGGACEASNMVDFDGQPRAYGPACDVGADELTP